MFPRVRFVTLLAVIAVVAGIVLGIRTTEVVAAVPDSLNFQGILKDNAGDPVPDANYTVTFAIYDAATGGTQLWTETQAVSTIDGLFTVYLGSVNAMPDSVLSAPNRFVGIKVNPDPEMAQRIALTSVAYAARVGSVEGAASEGFSFGIEDSASFPLDPDANSIESSFDPCPLPRCARPTSWYGQSVGYIGGTPCGTKSGSFRVTNGSINTINLNGWNGDLSAQGNVTFGTGHTQHSDNTLVVGCHNSILTTTSPLSSILGGKHNTINANSPHGVIGGGTDNTISASEALIGGGENNLATGENATIGGGGFNRARGQFSFIGGGGGSVIGDSNSVKGPNSVIGGGSRNSVNELSNHGTIGGGFFNRVIGTLPGGANYATIGGGYQNRIIDNVSYTTIAGGSGNTVDCDNGTVGGGRNNTAGSGQPYFAATVAGGGNNYAGSYYSAVGGGLENTADGPEAVVSGGLRNRATYYYATVPGGWDNTASGYASFAAGTRAKALHAGSFVLTDSNFADFASTVDNQFRVRAHGGVEIFTANVNCGDPVDNGASLPVGGGAWTYFSDRNAKENVTPIDGASLLNKVASIPVSEWNYKTQDRSIRHIGPMAQDFYATFGVGDNDKSISSIDPSGIALAAIQELKRQLDAKGTEVDELRAQVAELRAMISEKK